MNAIATVLLFLVGIQAVYSQGGGFGFGGGSYGYGGGFYGCSSYVPTLGYECYQPETGKNTVACLTTGSSVYVNAGYFGDYNAYQATDGQLSPGNSGFYHSNLEPYPWLRIQLRKPDNSDFEPKPITRVVIYQRCDANELYHQTNFEVKISEDPADPTKAVTPTPKLIGGLYCGRTTQRFFTGGTQFTVPCQAPASTTDAKEVYIQKTTLHSHGGGWPNYAGNQWNSYTGNAPAQNSNWPVCFLMINEIVLY